MIEINESSLGIWYVSAPGEDWLGHLGHAPDGRLEFSYRTRVYTDGKVFDSADLRIWRKIKAKSPDHSLSKMIQTIQAVVSYLIIDEPKARTWELIRGERSLAEFLDLLCAMPSVHHRFVPKDRP